MQKTSLLTIKNMEENLKRINGLWNSLSLGFYENFFESLKDNNVTDKELTLAVKYVRDTCKYPTPFISEFIGFIQKYREDYIPEKSEPTSEEIEAKKERDRLWQETTDAFNQKLLNGDFEYKEPEPPEEFK